MHYTHTLSVYFHLFCQLFLIILLKTNESKGTVGEGNVGTSTISSFFQEIRGLQQNLEEALLNISTIPYKGACTLQKDSAIRICHIFSSWNPGQGSFSIRCSRNRMPKIVLLLLESQALNLHQSSIKPSIAQLYLSLLSDFECTLIKSRCPPSAWVFWLYKRGGYILQILQIYN